MSCCSIKRDEFVKEKARNMREWLKPWVSVELQSLYDESKIVGLIVAGLLPLYSTGKLDEAVNELMSKLEGVSESEKDAVRAKVLRYFTCFCEALSS